MPGFRFTLPARTDRMAVEVSEMRRQRLAPKRVPALPVESMDADTQAWTARVAAKRAQEPRR